MNENVKRFYDLNPYPAINKLARVGMQPNMYEWSCEKVGRTVVETPAILIAGCGTIAPAVIAKQYPQASIIYAVDISENVLNKAQKTCGPELSKKIKWLQADISNDSFVSELSETNFDWVHCTGVLHHLEKPSDGIKNLSSLIADNGIMTVKVYSKGARVLINWARVAFRSKNAYNTSDVKQILVALSRFHPFRFVLATYPEALNDAGLKDGFLHPQVQAYYAEEWENYFIDNNMELSFSDVHDINEDMEDIFPEIHWNYLQALSTSQKIAILEKLGEWRSDLRFIAVKNNEIKDVKIDQKTIHTDYIFEKKENFSYPRNYLWQEAKYGLKTLNIAFTEEDLQHIINSLSPRVWATGLKGLYLRFKWSAWRDESRQFASSSLLFQEVKEKLIEDYFRSSEKQIYIPAPEDWPWQQWVDGFFAWDLEV
jgi:SAM-dependent methyltransferase